MKHRVIAAALICSLPLTSCVLDIYRTCDADIYGEPSGAGALPDSESKAETLPEPKQIPEKRSAEKNDQKTAAVTEPVFTPSAVPEDVPAEPESDSEALLPIYAPAGSGIEIADYSPQPASDSEAPLVVPAEIDGKPVVSVASFGFANAAYAHRLVLPETVTYFGAYAFSGSSVTTFAPAAAETVMEHSCFADCAQLEQIAFTEHPVRLEDYCFEYSAAAGITGTDCDLTAAAYCFRGMPKLAHAALHGDVTLGAYCFADCPMLSDVVLSEGSLTLGDFSFQNSAVCTVTIETCSSGTLGDYCFADCEQLETAVIGEGVTAIGISAFSGCAALKTVVLPDTLTQIGTAAFADCGSDLKFEVPADSPAEAFCRENGYAYSAGK